MKISHCVMATLFQSYTYRKIDNQEIVGGFFWAENSIMLLRFILRAMAAKFKSQKRLWSTWTFDWLPTYLTWTIVDIWLTTYLPHLVHVVCERPLMCRLISLVEQYFLLLITFCTLKKNIFWKWIMGQVYY